MWGESESASKNTSDPIFKIRKERFLIFPLACDLVLAENGIVTSCHCQVNHCGVRHCSLTAGSWNQHLQPHRGGSSVGGGSPRYWTVSLFPFLRTCIAAHSITSAVGSLLPEAVSHLIPCFHSGRREWQSPRMGRLALLPEENASALSA